jgi:hypothetical protein
MKKQWEAEKKQLLGEKAVLQDAAKRLNLQIRNAKEEVKIERAKAGSQEVSPRTVRRAEALMFCFSGIGQSKTWHR